MELFDYLMAKKGHNTGGDLFSYLLGKNAGGSGTYTTFSGISLNISNTLKAQIKNLKLNPTELTQDGTPTPESPEDVNVIKGDNTITISNSDNTQSQNYSINLGDLEYAKIGDYEDEIMKTSGKNLFDKDGSTFESLSFQGTNRWGYKLPKVSSNFYVSCLIGGLNAFRVVEDVNGTMTNVKQITATPTLITNTDNDFYLITIDTSIQANAQNIFDKNQFMMSVENIPYEPYGTNDWYLKENVDKITLNGTQTIGNINLEQENTSRVTYISIITNGINTIPLLCNRLERKNMFNSDEEGIYYNATNGNLFFRIKKTLIGTTTNEINTYLENNNIKAYFPVTSPIFKKITDTTLIEQLENLHNNATSYNGQTNITQTNDDLPFNISVDVKVKTE